MKHLDFISSILELHQKMVLPVSREYGLTSNELAILLFLANHPGEDTAAEIVRKRHLAKSHVSASVLSLEKRGLLRKEYRGNDRRAIHLVPEPAAREIIEKGQAAQADFCRILMTGVTEAEQKQLDLLFGRIGGNAQKALEARK